MGFADSVLKGSFIRNVLTLFSGSALAQLIGFALLPVLTRLYTPEEFGLFYIFLTTASILSLIVTGGYEKSFVINPSEDETKNLLGFSLLLLSGGSVLMFLVAGFLVRWSDSIFVSPQSRLILWMVPVFSFLFGALRIFQDWAIRNNKYNDVSGSNIIKNASVSVLQAGFGLIKSGEPGLVLGGSLGQIFPICYLIIKGKKKLRELKFHRIKDYINEGKKYKDFPLFKMPSDLVNELSLQSPIYILGIFFSKTVTGIFSLPHKVLNQPSRFVGKAAGDVYYRQAAEKYAQGIDISEFTFDLFKVLFLTGIIPFSLMVFWGQDLFSFVFGSAWEYSGRIGAWLSPWLLFVFAGSPVSAIFLIKNKIRLSFMLNLTLLFIRIIALLAGALILRNLEVTIILFAITSLLYWIFLSLYSLKLAGVSIRKALLFMITVVSIVEIPIILIKIFLL